MNITHTRKCIDTDCVVYRSISVWLCDMWKNCMYTQKKSIQMKMQLFCNLIIIAWFSLSAPDGSDDTGIAVGGIIMRFCVFQIYQACRGGGKVKTNVHEIIQSKLNRISAEYATSSALRVVLATDNSCQQSKLLQDAF